MPTIGFSLYGARIGVRAYNTAALNALIAVFPPNWKRLASPRVDCQFTVSADGPSLNHNSLTLYAGRKQIAVNEDLQKVVDAFEREMQLAIAQKARAKVFVHAGVVGWRGRAILIPGRTFTGKSTLVRALVRVGATYYSDEYAVLDTRGRVHPFARLLALRDEKYANQKISFDELGGTIGSEPLPVGTILVTHYREGAKWHPRRLTPGVGALELLANTVTARTKQVQVLKTLSRVTTQAVILKSARGDARTLAPQLLEMLG
ncbi:MAG TPA: hypothetical protein VFD70_20420 [Anaerolineae bacterium]|nr:hypothetical protein [Anaerolineae bacterium]